MSRGMIAKVYRGDEQIHENSSDALMVVGTDFSGIMCDCDCWDMIVLATRATTCLNDLKAEIIRISHGNLTKEQLEEIMSGLEKCSRQVDVTDNERKVNDLISRLKGGNK